MNHVNISAAFIILLFISVKCAGQNMQRYQVKKIGDKLPDITLYNVENYPNGELDLSNLGGKKVIFDFWNKWCGACISMMPKLTELQAKYKDSITVITVLSDTKEDLEKLRRRTATVKNFLLPIVVNDSILNKVFPHVGVPYYVWVDSNGTIQGVSGSTSINTENIDYFVRTGKMSLEVAKTDTIHSFENYIPVEKKVLKDQIYYSGFKKEPNTIRLVNKSGGRADRGNTITAGIFPDRALVSLYGIMYGKNEREITTFDKELEFLLMPTDFNKLEEWKRTTSYSYRIRIERAGAKVQDFGRKDLKERFGLDVIIDKIPRKVLVIKVKDKNKLVKASSKNDHEILVEDVPGYIFLKNAPMEALAHTVEERLNSKVEPLNFQPVINETNFEGTISLELKFNDTLKSLNQALSRYGLQVNLEYRDIEFMILQRPNINKYFTLK